jgi:carbonic anhydrase
MLTVEQPCETVMAAGGLPAVYRLEQIHFHWQSEHTLEGKRLGPMFLVSQLVE